MAIASLSYPLIMDQRTALITLADTLAAHHGVTHYAISMRALGKGDFFKKLKDGGDCRTTTAARVLSFFDENWAGDLEWTAHIDRPENKKNATSKGRAA